MTVNEKIIINTHNFDHIWYHYHLNIPKKNSVNSTELTFYKLFVRNKEVFSKTFIKYKKYTLTDLLKNCKSFNTLWEVPKGRKNTNETKLDCALREFKEETGINSKFIHIIDHVPFTYKFNNSNVNYRYVYFLAVCFKRIKPEVYFNNADQILEVEQIKWSSKHDISTIDDNRLKTITSKIFSICKNIKARNLKYKYMDNISNILSNKTLFDNNYTRNTGYRGYVNYPKYSPNKDIKLRYN